MRADKHGGPGVRKGFLREVRFCDGGVGEMGYSRQRPVFRFAPIPAVPGLGAAAPERTFQRPEGFNRSRQLILAVSGWAPAFRSGHSFSEDNVLDHFRT